MDERADGRADYYRILGVPRDATLERIQRAYKRLARQWHPEIGGGSDERLRVLQDAYETLSNPEARARYDRALAFDRRPASSAIPVSVSYHESAWTGEPESASGEILLSADEAAVGGVLPLKIPMQSTCRECAGSGGLFWMCAACDGVGRRETRVPVVLRIPAGVRDGTIFQVRLDESERTSVLLAVHILQR